MHTNQSEQSFFVSFSILCQISYRKKQNDDQEYIWDGQEKNDGQRNRVICVCFSFGLTIISNVKLEVTKCDQIVS